MGTDDKMPIHDRELAVEAKEANLGDARSWPRQVPGVRPTRRSAT